jgi:hypothetical protein
MPQIKYMEDIEEQIHLYGGRIRTRRIKYEDNQRRWTQTI